jgi:hypothetical protein
MSEESDHEEALLAMYVGGEEQEAAAATRSNNNAVDGEEGEAAAGPGERPREKRHKSGGGGGRYFLVEEQLCSNCNQPGHILRNCTLPYASSAACFFCGQIGHIQTNCPLKVPLHFSCLLPFRTVSVLSFCHFVSLNSSDGHAIDQLCGRRTVPLVLSSWTRRASLPRPTPSRRLGQRHRGVDSEEERKKFLCQLRVGEPWDGAVSAAAVRGGLRECGEDNAAFWKKKRRRKNGSGGTGVLHVRTGGPPEEGLSRQGQASPERAVSSVFFFFARRKRQKKRARP